MIEIRRETLKEICSLCLQETIPIEVHGHIQCEKCGGPLQEKRSEVSPWCIGLSLPEFIRGSAGSAGSGVRSCGSEPPFHAPGARMA